MTMADPKPERTEYPLNENTKVFYCKQCRTHIALFSEVEDFHFGRRKWVQFKNVVNVNIGEDNLVSNGLSIVKSVNCKTCNADLGFDLLYLFKKDKDVRSGSYLITKEKLMIWCRGHTFDMATVESRSD